MGFLLGQGAACGPVAIFEIGSSGGGGSDAPDTMAPETLLISGPAAFVSQASAEFEFASNEAVDRFEARVFRTGTVPGSWTAVASPHTVQVAGEGEYTFECRAVDLAGNVDATPSSYQWAVDLERPTPPATLTVVPTQTTIFELAWSSAADTFSGVGAYRVYYETDPGTPNVNEGPSGFSVGLLNSLRLTGLAPCQDYTVWVTAVDRAGNESDPSLGVVRVLRAWCGWDGTFSPLLYPVGLGPEGIVAEDFNADGVADLAVLNRASEDISLLLGNRGGELQVDAMSRYSAGVTPTAILASDFNHDNSMDVVALTMSSGLQLLYGAACGGGFETAFRAGAAPSSTCIAAAAWTSDNQIVADGSPDLLVGNTYVRGCDSTIPNDCDVCDNFPGAGGVFEEICGFDSSPGIACVAGDFNEDGRMDGAVLADDGRVRVGIFGASGQRPGQCYGYCQGQVVLTSVAGLGASCLVVADFNSDGHLDLALGNAQVSFLVVLLGNGNGSFSAPFPYAAGARTHALVVADFNADGIGDLGAATSTGFAVLLGNGANGQGDGTFAEPIVGLLGYATRSVAAGDFDADGITDLALSVPSFDAVCVLSGGGGTRPGDGTFLPTELLLAREAVDVVRGDFNRDGILDLATGSSDGVTDVFLGNGRERHGEGTFRYVASYVLPIDPAEFRNFSWAAGDFDGDQDPDLVVNAELSSGTKHFGRSFFLRGTGNASGAFVLPSGASPPSVFLQAMLAADFDRDGLSDLAGFNPDPNRLEVYFGHPTSPFGSGASMNTFAETLVATDFNGDGRLDIALGNGSGVRIARKNVGSGFTLGAEFVVPGITDASIAASDFNADGLVDLAVVGSSSLRVLLGHGSGCEWDLTFDTAISLHDGHVFERLMGGDFDGDGIIDLVATERGDVLFLRGTGSDGRGDGGFAAPVPIPGPIPGRAHGAVVTGDFDTDGSLDLVLTNESSPVLSVLLGGAGGP